MGDIIQDMKDQADLNVEVGRFLDSHVESLIHDVCKVANASNLPSGEVVVNMVASLVGTILRNVACGNESRAKALKELVACYLSNHEAIVTKDGEPV